MSGFSRKPFDPNPQFDIQRSEEMQEESKWQWREFLNFLKEYYDIKKKKEDILKYIQENPKRSTVVLVTMAMCAVPITCFLLFVICSFIFTLMCFLMFEGTVLAVGTLFLVFTVFVVGCIGVGLSIMLIGGYKSFQMTTGIWKTGRDFILMVPFLRNLVITSKEE